jgi:SAM-dependent methyltransferase
MSEVIWHDLECGSYAEDLPLWRKLAAHEGSPILELGAGSGRVSLDLARHGFEVTALDANPVLLGELERRARGLTVETVLADARAFELEKPFALCLVPMQTIQLLGGAQGRAGLLASARAHLCPGGLLAVALSAELPEYAISAGIAAPLPDMCERGGTLYFSHPTAIYAASDGFVLERRREVVTQDGARTVVEDRIQLDRLDPLQLENEGTSSGFTRAGRAAIPATADYAGSEVVMLRA